MLGDPGEGGLAGAPLGFAEVAGSDWTLRANLQAGQRGTVGSPWWRTEEAGGARGEDQEHGAAALTLLRRLRLCRLRQEELGRGLERMAWHQNELLELQQLLDVLRT